MRFELIDGQPPAGVVDGVLEPLRLYNWEKNGSFFQAR